MSEPTVLLERTNGIATVTLNRPAHRNGITADMMRELHVALRALATDKDVRVVVLKGQGADFCPGADIKHYASSARGDSGTPTEYFQIPVMLHEMSAVTIAAVSGACAGAGFGWACACDFRIASETARFNSAFLDVAVAGDMGGPWTLPRLVGAAKARELYFLPGKFDAAEALRIGLVSKVSAAADFEHDVRTLADRLAAAAPLAIRAMKDNFVAAEKVGFADYIALETDKHQRIFQSEDTKEAFRAFVEKRKPAFKGR